MAIPTGSGTEVLRRGSITSQSSDATSFKWDGTNPTLGTDTDVVPANHIITVLSMTFTEVGGSSDELLNAKLHNGTAVIWLLLQQPLGPRATFIFSDKIVLVGGDALIVSSQAAAEINVWYSYIDQDWT